MNSNNKSTLNDIKTGKGLPPIKTQPTSSEGITHEQRNQNSDGIRKDRFTIKTNKSDRKK